MTQSANRWGVLAPNSRLLHTWTVPFTGREPVRLTVRRGSVGLTLVHAAMFWDESVERLDLPGPRDDWSIAFRPIRQGTVPSNHSSGTAIDLNATRHPRGVSIHKTFTPAQIAALNRYLKAPVRDGLLTWGGWWPSNDSSSTPPDGMHIEVAVGVTLAQVEHYARTMCASQARRVNAILKANPGQERVIFS